MIGEVVETAASYEARYAPPPYPTIIRSPLRATTLPDHHSKPATRHCPTRLRGIPGNWYPYRDLHNLMEVK